MTVTGCMLLHTPVAFQCCFPTGITTQGKNNISLVSDTEHMTGERGAKHIPQNTFKLLPKPLTELIIGTKNLCIVYKYFCLLMLSLVLCPVKICLSATEDKS